MNIDSRRQCEIEGCGREYSAIRNGILVRRIRKLVGKESVGSGMGWGERDIHWTFRDKSKALQAAKRLKKAIRGLRADVEEEEG